MLGPILELLAGLILVFAGKRFFWLVAGLVGFLFAWGLIGDRLGATWLGLIAGLILAVVLGWLAVKFVKVVAYFLGIAAGAFILPSLFGLFGLNLGFLIEAVLGGIIGLLLMMFFFHWGLILLTAMMGASAVGGSLGDLLAVGQPITGLLFLGLFVAGVIVQARGKD